MAVPTISRLFTGVPRDRKGLRARRSKSALVPNLVGLNTAERNILRNAGAAFTGAGSIPFPTPGPLLTGPDAPSSGSAMIVYGPPPAPHPPHHMMPHPPHMMLPPHPPHMMHAPHPPHHMMPHPPHMMPPPHPPHHMMPHPPHMMLPPHPPHHMMPHHGHGGHGQCDCDCCVEVVEIVSKVALEAITAIRAGSRKKGL